ncbi:troponin T, cardiac muscle isoforms-like isoform X1 [Asterias rubens]|uniref:troponin T, cardiac muscle isoforms-like isoform X1 n=1 Tax=Asterias rubens TaxID=7604 RepID=UPI001455DAEE|nr:troponin T, cardiac muscle isoforms-like isoform X1 [Asterias rubens]
MAAPESEESETMAVIKEREEKRKEELKMELIEARDEIRRKSEEKAKELQELRAKRDARRAQQAEEQKLREQYEAERREKEKVEKQKRKEMLEMKKKEREASLKAMHNPDAYHAIIVEKEEPKKKPKKSQEELEKEKEAAMRERIQPLSIGGSTAEEKIREIARNLLQRLSNIYADIFDMKCRKKRQVYDHTELLQRIADLTKVKEPHSAEAAGTVHKFKDGGVFKPQEHDHKTKMQMDAEAGSIMSSGGVKGRSGMFGGGSEKKTPGLDRAQTIDLTK